MAADHPELIWGGLKSCFGMSVATPGGVLPAAADLQNLDKSGLDGSRPSKTKFGESEIVF